MRVAVQNVADEKQVKNAGKRDRDRGDREREDLHRILQSEYGRRFVYRILGETKVYGASYAQDGNDTAFNEGKRRIGLWLIQQIESADSRAYLQMLGEQMEGE